jgi:hypothetical protein
MQPNKIVLVLVNISWFLGSGGLGIVTIVDDREGETNFHSERDPKAITGRYFLTVFGSSVSAEPNDYLPLD